MVTCIKLQVMEKTTAQIISLQSDAFQKLVDTVVEYVKEKHLTKEDVWITGDEAMRLLNISSKTTLQVLRDTGKLKYSQPMHKVLLYNKESIISYIEKHAQETF